MIIAFHKAFEKKYKKAPPFVARRFKERRDLFLRDPSHPILNLHPLSGDRDGQWSLNVTGDWRAIFVFLDAHSIVFIDIDMHSNLYK